MPGILLEAPDYSPVQVRHVELTSGLRDLLDGANPVGRSGSVLTLIRLHTLPLGAICLRADAGNPTVEWPRVVWEALRPAISAHLEADGCRSPTAFDVWNGDGWRGRPCLAGRRAALATARPATVVVATRERPFRLAQCLDSLLRLEYPTYEVLVVDNAPLTEDTVQLVATRYIPTGRVHYLRENQRGLGAAHNRALEVARGEILAFTDDDVEVDRHWLAELAVPLVSEPGVSGVTGLIFPAELETPAQAMLAASGRVDKGFSPRLFDLSHRSRDRLFPFAAGRMGSGANMAFDAAYLRGAGGFDAALGTGTPARGGDDLEAFFRLVVSGHKLAYQPSAVVWHHYDRSPRAVPRQVHGYGVGLGAYLTSALTHSPRMAGQLIPRVPAGLAYLLRQLDPDPPPARDLAGSAWDDRHQGEPSPTARLAELGKLQRRGFLLGPLAYARSRLSVRHGRRPQGPGRDERRPFVRPRPPAQL